MVKVCKFDICTSKIYACGNPTRVGDPVDCAGRVNSEVAPCFNRSILGMHPNIVRTAVARKKLDSYHVCEFSLLAHPSMSACRTTVSYRSYIDRDFILENSQNEHLPGERQHYERSLYQHCSYREGHTRARTGLRSVCFPGALEMMRKGTRSFASP